MRVTIKTSLFTLIGVLLLVMAGQGWVALSNLGAINQNVERQAKIWLPSVEVINQINTYTTGLRAAQAAHIMSTKPAGMEKAAGSAKAWEKRLEDRRKIYEPLITSDEERTAYNAFIGKFEAYKKLHERLIELSEAGEKEPAASLFRGEMRKVFYDLSQDLGQVSAINSKGAADDYARAQNSYSSARLNTFIAILLGLLLGVGAIVFAVLGISRPITRITSAMQKVSAGNFAADIPYAGNRNEIGEMSAALTIFRDGLAETEQLRAQQAETERRSAELRKEEMRRLADSFEATVGGIVGTVSSAALELEAAASTLTQTAEATQGLSGSAAAASEQTSNNVQSVASATEEMSSSVSEIGRQVQESSEIARGAVSQAEKADAQIAHLSHAASRIGDVVKLITEIAEQTNLLALNATIEAARAGEAGRGFAVVASEVKALAAQTAKATDEISTQIAGMQTATGESVMAIKEIGGTITRIAEIANSIASAVEEQGVATQEITRSVNQASQGTQQVATDITEVNRGAGETGSAATQVFSSAKSFSRESDHLKVEVNKFLKTVRAA